MRVGEARQIDVGQRVAVDDEERIGADDRAREPRAAGAAENRRQLPRVADARAEVAAVAEAGGDRLRPMMQVEHQIVDARARPATRRCAGSSGCRRPESPAWRERRSAAAGACRGRPSAPVRDGSSTRLLRVYDGHGVARPLCDPHPERAAAERRRADALAENQDLVRAADAARQHQRLELRIADRGFADRAGRRASPIRR